MQEIQLIFDPGKGGIVPLSRITAIVGDRVGAMPKPTRKGHIFAGWYLSPNGDPRDPAAIRITAETTLDLTVLGGASEEATLVAKWEKPVAKSAVTQKTSLGTQKKAIAVLIVVAMMLALALGVVSFIVDIYGYEDLDGTEYTIKKKKGGFENLTVGVCGDLKYGRTVHSLISALSRYEGVRFVLIAPEELKLPDYVKDEYLYGAGCEFVETENLDKAIPSLDILYMTRIQAERFDSKEEYERLKDSYILTKDKLEFAKEDLSILHPLPRVNEIDVNVDDDPRADYFDQAMYGRYIRMALILMLLKTKGTCDKRMHGAPDSRLYCANPHCISRSERGIKHLFDEGRCIYCDQMAEKL